MKNAIIFHGTDDHPDNHWYDWLKSELLKAGYRVEVPYNPQINKIPVAEFLPQVLKQHTFDKDTLLVGHSAGGPLILSILENIDVNIAQAILVASYSTHPDEQMEDPILQETYQWEKIKANVSDITFINSVNDPWNCTDEQGRLMFDKLGGTLIIKNEGHFGSDFWKQKYTEFPLLRALILGKES